MGKKYPKAQKLLDMIAEKNAISRVQLGVHFMSDIEGGREMADKVIERYEPSAEEVKTKQLQYKDLPAHVYGKEAY